MQRKKIMKIKPVDNVYLGTQLPQKQKDKNMKDEGPISYNGRMVDKDNIDKGLLALSGYLSNEVDADNFNSCSNDYNYYQEAIQAARDYLLED